MTYRALISKATGETDPQRLADIEECMRQDVFHSTLDWQSAAELAKGAREAVQILAYVATLA